MTSTAATHEDGSGLTLPKGVLKLNAPVSFGVPALGPLIAAFIAQYPDLKIELTLNDRMRPRRCAG